MLTKNTTCRDHCTIVIPNRPILCLSYTQDNFKGLFDYLGEFNSKEASLQFYDFDTAYLSDSVFAKLIDFKVCFFYKNMNSLKKIMQGRTLSKFRKCDLFVENWDLSIENFKKLCNWQAAGRKTRHLSVRGTKFELYFDFKQIKITLRALKVSSVEIEQVALMLYGFRKYGLRDFSFEFEVSNPTTSFIDALAVELDDTQWVVKTKVVCLRTIETTLSNIHTWERDVYFGDDFILSDFALYNFFALQRYNQSRRVALIFRDRHLPIKTFSSQLFTKALSIYQLNHIQEIILIHDKTDILIKNLLKILEFRPSSFLGRLSISHGYRKKDNSIIFPLVSLLLRLLCKCTSLYDLVYIDRNDTYGEEFGIPSSFFSLLVLHTNIRSWTFSSFTNSLMSHSKVFDRIMASEDESQFLFVDRFFQKNPIRG